jgi:hypothetical protein
VLGTSTISGGSPARDRCTRWPCGSARCRQAIGERRSLRLASVTCPPLGIQPIVKGSEIIDRDRPGRSVASSDVLRLLLLHP